MSLRPALLCASSLALLIAAPGCATAADVPAADDAAAKGAAPAVQPDWLTTVNVSESGGHILGNPEATYKIAEYVSYTCGHCATFEIDGAPKLKADFIADGTASLEMRNMPLNAVDLTVSLLARCGPSEGFFGRHKFWLKNQSEWIKTAGNISAATKALAAADDKHGMALGIYNDMGLGSFAAKTGLTDEAAKSCLADKDALAAIMGMNARGRSEFGIRGTPSFVVNDETASGVHSYSSLKQLLDGEQSKDEKETI